MKDVRIHNSSIIIRLLAVIVLISESITLIGQERSVRFQHLTIEDGLSQNMVDCMLQDSRGFLWFGTWNGLCRYDGYEFDIFNNEPSSSISLNNNFVYSLQEDRFGNIWVGTQKGLYLYLYNQGHFLPAKDLLDTDQVLLTTSIRSLAIHQDSVLLVGSDEGLSFVTILGKNGEIELNDHLPFGAGNSAIAGSVVNTILNDRENNIWVGTDEGVAFFSAGTRVPQRIVSEPGNFNSLSSDQILSIYEDTNDEIWMGTEYGLNHYASGNFQHFFNDSSDPSSLVHNSVMDILEDEAGNLVIATLGGLSIMHQKDQHFTNYQHRYRAEHSLTNDFINCLLKDEAGNIWIGTERGGINFYNTNQNIIEHFEFSPNESNSLSHSTVNSVYEDETSLWIGTAGGGLNRYDKANKTYNYFQYNSEDNRTISSDFVTSLHRDQKGRLWVGTWGGGLNILLNENTSQAYFLHHQSQTQPGVISNFISSITEDSTGNLWIGTLGGLMYYDLAKNTFESKFSADSPIPITEVGCLLFDANENLWAGTRKGLFHIRFRDKNPDEYEISRYEHDPSNPHSISGNYVISQLEDDDGNLWFGTYGQGINRLIQRGDSVSFAACTMADGLNNNIIYSIQQGRRGNLWLSTDFGLSRLHPETTKIRNFYKADGLLNNQYYWSASYKNHQGKLFFGGMSGLDAFYPDQIQEVAQNPRVVITDIKLLNESVVPGEKYRGVEVMQESTFQTKEIFLSYREKILGIEFSSLNYLEPDLIRYAYQLEGFEPDWNYVSADRRYASYTNLPPGNYTFKIRASDSNGTFSSEPKKLFIHITPPFWDTVWFKLLSLIGLTALVFSYIRFRTYALKRQKILLEQQVKERTERVYQQKEALAYQAVQLLGSNQKLEEKQKLIAGQNHQLEHQNKEILSQRDELIRLNKKLKLVSQLKLNFFTNISHEFRTPLTLIVGPIEKLIRENKMNPDAQHTLNIINRNAQRLLHLINQIMDFRKLEKGRMVVKVTQNNLSEFCENIFCTFEPLAELRGIRFHYREKGLPEEVWFDSLKLENVLYNLLSNAFKYTPQGGRVIFEVTGLTYQESKLKNAASPTSYHKPIISIKVIDTGVGISQENLPLVFKRFYRIESEEAFKVSGSGIGLALAEELIKTHHGNIFVESTLDEGSVFEVQFPCLKGSYEADEVSEKNTDVLTIDQQVELLKNEFLVVEDLRSKTDAPRVYKKEWSTVLVVEDNIDLRNFIVHRLNTHYNILEAEDGEVGLRLAEKKNPDVVISDIMMPKIDGLELCATMKNNLSTSHIPIILLTAKSTVENRIKGLETGADDYLPKPFNFDLLEARIQNLIDSRKRLRLHFTQSVNFQVKQATTTPKDQAFLERAIMIIEDNIENPDFGTQQLITSMGVSRSLLYKKLTALTNQSTTGFMNHLRMKKARQLLEQKELNISEVAYAVGYNDPKYFSRLFNKYYDQSPSDYLRKAEANN